MQKRNALQQSKPHTGQLWTSLILLLLTTSACVSVQWRDGDGNLRSAGFIHYSVIDTGRARVFEHRTAGLNVRLTSFDGGVTLGYRKYIAIQPCNETGCIANKSSGILWSNDVFSKEEGLYLRKALGAEVGTDALQNGLRVGFTKQTIIFGPKAKESVISKIEFNEANLEATSYLQERGN